MTEQEKETLENLCFAYKMAKDRERDTETELKMVGEEIKKILGAGRGRKHILAFDPFEKYKFEIMKQRRLYPSSAMKRRIKLDPKSKVVELEVLQMRKMSAQ